MLRPSRKLLRIVVRSRAVVPWLPWVSLVWGIASGTLLARVYAKAATVMVYTFVFIVLSAGFVLWLKWLELNGQRSRLGQRRTQMVDFFLDAVSQTSFQYVVMFTVPFLWLSGSYLTLIAAVSALATTLWSPWRERFSRSTLYLCCLRTLCGMLGLSFCLVVFRPDLLPRFYPLVWGSAVVLALPFEHFYRARRVTGGHYVLTGMLAVMVAIGAIRGKWLPFPLVSCWLRQPAIGVGVIGHEVLTPWPKTIAPVTLGVALATGQRICCATPLVSPRGLNHLMVHEWFADSKLIDTVSLKDVNTSAVNESERHPYHTHSCKDHFPKIDDVLNLSCRARIAGVVIGSVTVRVE